MSNDLCGTGMGLPPLVCARAASVSAIVAEAGLARSAGSRHVVAFFLTPKIQPLLS